MYKKLYYNHIYDSAQRVEINEKDRDVSKLILLKPFEKRYLILDDVLNEIRIVIGNVERTVMKISIAFGYEVDIQFCDSYFYVYTIVCPKLRKFCVYKFDLDLNMVNKLEVSFAKKDDENSMCALSYKLFSIKSSENFFL